MDNRNQPGRTPKNHSRPPSQGNRPGRPPRGKKKKKFNILPALVLGVIGVVAIALIIMGVKTVVENSAGSGETAPTPSPEAVATAAPEPTPTPETAPTPAKENSIEGLDVQDLDSMVIVGDAGYSYYKYDNDGAAKYIDALNKAAGNTTAKVYNMILPSSIDVMLPLSFLDKYAEQTSDQGKASKYIQSKLSDSLVKVPVYDALKAHCNESLYFKTDEHVTSLGAYYVYEQWAKAKGVTPVALSEFKKTTYSGFLGSLYVQTESSALESEDVEVYESTADLSMHYTYNGELIEGVVYADVTDYSSPYKYSTFLCGSDTYTEIKNNDLSDGSACVVVTDSNGTPFAPYLSSHYENTYVIDYRNYSGTASGLAEEKGASDIIYMTSIAATRSDSLLKGLDSVAG